mgnify:CR=1 FL=1
MKQFFLYVRGINKVLLIVLEMRATVLLSLAYIFEIIFKMLYKSTSKFLIVRTLNEEHLIKH